MANLTTEQIQANFALWQTKLQEFDCFSQEMIDEMGSELMMAPFSMEDKNGGAYAGAMIKTVLYQLCTIATQFNEKIFGMQDKDGRYIHPKLYVNKNMLIRTLLLQHISKAEIFTHEEEEWRVKKGFKYTFNKDLNTSMKLGERSTYLCMKYGIKLSEEEFHAMRTLDKGEDIIINPFMHPLAYIVRMVNQIVAMENVEKQ